MQERAVRSRMAIIEGAAAAFEELGYAGAGFAEIVRRSGLTSGGVQFHFAHKEDLAAGVVESCAARLLAELAQAKAPPAATLSRLHRRSVVVRAGLRLIVERAPAPPAGHCRRLVDAISPVSATEAADASEAAEAADTSDTSDADAPDADPLATVLFGALLGAQAMAPFLGGPEGVRTQFEYAARLLTTPSAPPHPRRAATNRTD
ncbi:AcrR family transcriptional regulator [Kitasatospora sp. GAS204A]|uniref:TetR/AcrR family transcriptional regulator n=1 Tax=unclassified Kitasatospora TaxID=2633591 RepID=UPI0024741493|nr:TetR/AcrR family transcriptional regulator [Kitasatospora sp. GAS204B]MDH6117252.1 AcrR family transcriptional regulator [Kitasatospora sp. GAS204B]